MKIFFAGTPDIAVPSLELLHGQHSIVGVLTNPDKPGGRGRALEPSPVKVTAERLGLHVFQPTRLDTDFIETVRVLSPELLVVVAYGRIFKDDFLSIFPSGGINLHPSLLPLYRGSSPIQAAILSGDKETGVTVQRVAKEMDSGNILAVRKIPLDGTETGGSLTTRAGMLGAKTLADVLRQMEEGTLVDRTQDSAKVTYCYRIRKEDGRIDWRKSAVLIERTVRAYNPWPGAWTTWKGKRVVLCGARVFEENTPPMDDRPPGLVTGVDKEYGFLVQTGNGVLAVDTLQLQAKKVMDWKSFLNGNGGFPGSVLGSSE